MSQHPRMTCRECIEFLMDYLSNELPDPSRTSFESHLQKCPNCVRYLESYKTTITLARTAFEVREDEVPAKVPEELIQAILAARRAL